MHLFMRNVHMDFVNPTDDPELDLKTDITTKFEDRNYSTEFKEMLEGISSIKGILERKIIQDPLLIDMLLPIYSSYRFEPRLRALAKSVVINIDSYELSHKDIKYAVENNLSICRPSTTGKYIKMIQFVPYKLQFYWIHDLKNRWIIQLESENCMLSLIDTGLKIHGKNYLVRDYMDIQRIEIQLWKEANVNNRKQNSKVGYSPII